MAKQTEAGALRESLTQILFDPLRYIHPQRLRLPRSFDTARQRAIVNRMLLGDALHSPPIGAHPRRLLQHWRRLPYVCSLVGAQLLKPSLALRGRSLHLPAPVRFFMALPLRQLIAGQDDLAPLVDWRSDADPLRQVQRAGLSCVLDWQQQAPAALLARMRLLFAPQLDACFDGPRQPLQASELFLISQAILYAKNHPYQL